MRRLVRSTAILGLGSVATVVAAIARAKILAARLGPEGTGVLAQLASLTAVLVPLATLGVGNGLVAMIAEARAAGDFTRVHALTRMGKRIAWGVGGGLAAAAMIASPWLAAGIYRDSGFTWAILLGAAAVPLSALASLHISMLQGHQAVRSMAGLNVAIAVAQIATIVPLAIFFGVHGAVAQLVVIGAIWAWWSGRLVARHTPRDAWGAGGVSAEAAASGGAARKALLRPLLRYGISSLLVGLSSTLTLLILRSMLVDKLGLGPNGIYQVCVGVSGLLMPTILNAITATVWPEIAALTADADAGPTMRSGVRLAFLLTTGFCAAILVGAPIWVPLFYSGRFLPALDLLPLQFLGDYFRAAAWMFGIWLVPRNRLRPWVLFDVIYGVTLLGAFVLLVDKIGLRSVVLGYVLAHMTHAGLHYMLARRALGFRLGPDNRRLLLASLALLLGLYVWTPKSLIGVGLGGLALVVWALVVVRRHEWLAMIDIARRRLVSGGSAAT
ncbi:MAG TPA: oligosaccharide flippase family protein [Candidatus Eisenbacteria bacterium]|nr:oligosaccharide flippase family protein [Candidatus Eisenbacteria bacterium]